MAGPVQYLPRRPAALRGLQRLIQRMQSDFGPGARAINVSIAQYPEQPSVEIGPRFEPRKILEGFQQRLLHQVFGILMVAGQAIGDAIDAVRVTLYQRLKILACTVRWNPSE